MKPSPEQNKVHQNGVNMRYTVDVIFKLFVDVFIIGRGALEDIDVFGAGRGPSQYKDVVSPV